MRSPFGQAYWVVPCAALFDIGTIRDSERNRKDWSAMKVSLKRRVIAEFTGSLLLLSAVVGPGIMGEHLAGGNIAIALLANTIATGAA
jgi:hypothetical protein